MKHQDVLPLTYYVWFEAKYDCFLYVFHLSPPSNYAGGKRVLQRPFHLSLSVAHSSLMFQAFRSLLAVSFHLNFGLPLGRFRSIFISATARMFSGSSLLLTCPNHSSLLITIAFLYVQSFIVTFTLTLFSKSDVP